MAQRNSALRILRATEPPIVFAERKADRGFSNRTSQHQSLRDSYRDRCVLVRAAFCAVWRRPDLPFVRTAFIAALCLEARPRRRAALRAWRARAEREAELRRSRFNAFVVARDRVREVWRPCERPLAKSRRACFLTLADERARFGGASFTPARRALERPIAMACCGELAPCLPSRMWWISSRMNSPA